MLAPRQNRSRFRESGSLRTYPVFNRLSLASKAVLSGDPDPDRIAALSFDDFVGRDPEGI
jgi:hypothetical protein